MAISETMSNSGEWMQFYPTNVAQTQYPTAAAALSRNTNNNDNNLRLDHGRISKPLRRRSRTSKRTPTTLFNTDTTNFRAMVQQFTGGHIATRSQLPRTTTGGASATLGNFSVFGSQQIAATTMAPAASGFHMHYSNQLPQEVQQNMFMMQGGGAGLTGVSSYAPPGFSFFQE